jgi:betaine-aldehyde dehydrogenase
MREETFGPTLPVMQVADEAEAIRLANDCNYGLSATVWTGDLARGEAVARHLQAGAVNINDAYANFFCFALPHGGWKESGVGSRLGGAHGMRKYCREQAITRPRTPTLRNEPLWYPYTRRRIALVARILRALVARDPRRRLTKS